MRLVTPTVSWLRENADPIAAVKDIVTIIVAPFAVASLVFAGLTLYLASSQLNIASSQLNTTANNMKGNMVYQLVRDGREINKELTSEMLNDRDKVGLALHFMHNVWYQNRIGTIDDIIWKPITNELCSFLRRYEAGFASFWTPANQAMYSREFVAFIADWRKTCAS
jgi:hypothetical protein